MRLIAVLSIWILGGVAGYAQGTVHFNTRIAGVVDAPVYVNYQSLPPGPDYSAELVIVGPEGSMTPVPGSITTFRDGSEASYVVTIPEVAIPGVPPGGSVLLSFRAWLTSAGSYDTAPARGISAPVLVQNLGGGVQPPANLAGLQGFVMDIIPEPSPVVIGMLGLGVLLLRGRR